MEELALLLRRENCADVCVLKVDPALAYVDYLCVTTCRSHRHMVALAEYLNKVFKHKNNRGRGLTMEGVKSAKDGWVAIDMGMYVTVIQEYIV